MEEGTGVFMWETDKGHSRGGTLGGSVMRAGQSVTDKMPEFVVMTIVVPIGL